jgi:hypothetical protein
MKFLITLPSGEFSLRGHPGWLTDGDTPETSRPLTADELVDAGFGLLVIEEPPAVGSLQYAQQKPIADWVIAERTATITYDIIDLPPPPTPRLTPRQLRLGLLSVGITEAQIDAALEGNATGIIEWKYATEYKRDHPLILSLAPAFSLTETQVDQLWSVAATL